MRGIDDFIKQAELDELADKIEITTHATPIEYARARGMAPQKVYYALRNHKESIRTEQCKCGRRVLDITLADIYFGFKDDKATGNIYAEGDLRYAEKFDTEEDDDGREEGSDTEEADDSEPDEDEA
jgi:hypothetical protein